MRCGSPCGHKFLLAAEDLGYLLTRCVDVVVRDGPRIVSVPAGVLLGWRVLEIVLAAPYLPPPEQLRALFPSMQVREGILSLPLGLRSAEEALAQCSAAQVPVAATRVTYRARDR